MNKKEYLKALKLRKFILKVYNAKWYKLSDDIIIKNTNI
jgi:hypothetical protein